MKILRLVLPIMLISTFTFFYGCEKEVSDILAPAQESEYQGNYTFNVLGDYRGEKSIIINDRGFFAFYIQLRDVKNIDLFPVVVTGAVNDNGALTGNIYKFGDEIGVLSGQIAQGDFTFSYSGINYVGTYSMTGGSSK